MNWRTLLYCTSALLAFTACGDDSDVVSISPDGYKQVSAGRFNPDGNKLALVGEKGDDFALLTVNTDGAGAKELVPDGLGYLSSMAWSPDGNTIYYGSDEGISRIAADGSGEPEVVIDSFAVMQMDVSPDGLHIVWSTNGGGSISVGEIQEGTTPSEDIHSTGLAGSNPRFNPDGSRIVFVSGSTFSFATPTYDEMSWESSVEAGPDGAGYLSNAAWMNNSNLLILSNDEVREWKGSGAGESVLEAFAGKDLDYSAKAGKYVLGVNGQTDVKVYSF